MERRFEKSFVGCDAVALGEGVVPAWNIVKTPGCSSGGEVAGSGREVVREDGGFYGRCERSRSSLKSGGVVAESRASVAVG